MSEFNFTIFSQKVRYENRKNPNNIYETVYWIERMSDENGRLIFCNKRKKFINPSIALSPTLRIWLNRSGNFNSRRNALRQLRAWAKKQKLNNYNVKHMPLI